MEPREIFIREMKRLRESNPDAAIAAAQAFVDMECDYNVRGKCCQMEHVNCSCHDKCRQEIRESIGVI